MKFKFPGNSQDLFPKGEHMNVHPCIINNAVIIV